MESALRDMRAFKKFVCGHSISTSKHNRRNCYFLLYQMSEHSYIHFSNLQVRQYRFSILAQTDFTIPAPQFIFWAACYPNDSDHRDNPNHPDILWGHVSGFSTIYSHLEFCDCWRLLLIQCRYSNCQSEEHTCNQQKEFLSLFTYQLDSFSHV